MPGGGGGRGQATSKTDEMVDFTSSGTPGDGILCRICDSTIGGGLEGLSKAALPGDA
jgi:hypothetical protein